MRIKQYIVTYNNNDVLNKCLESLLPTFTNSSKADYECFIINNHTNFYIDDKFKEFVTIIHNNLRPDSSTGHLSRNWNEAIINGFDNLNNPISDILITNQNDCEFQPNFLEEIIELHKKYSFVQFGAGDNFISYKVESVKKVGLWDERFCNIGYQEADYFLRQLLYNTHECSINDYLHHRVHNPEENKIIKNSPTGHQRGDTHHLNSVKYHTISHNVYQLKWNCSATYTNTCDWSYEKLSHLTPQTKSFMYYPYFEKDVETLKEQNFII